MDMLFQRMQKYYDIVHTDNQKEPSDIRQQDVHCSLRRPWRILESRAHAGKTEKTMTGWKNGFILIFSGNFDLSISSISFQSR